MRIYLLSDVFRKFFQDHAPEFQDAPPFLEGDEHNLEYYNLFQTYLEIYEVWAVQEL